MLTKLQVLVGMRHLLTKPESWVKGFDALSKEDNSVAPESKEATKFCLVGAKLHVTGGKNVGYLTQDLFPDLGCVAVWNDDACRTHAEVLQKLDEAIARQEKENASLEPVSD